MTEIPGNFKHQQFHADFTKLLKKWAGHMSSAEMLAVASHAVGQIVALQDQRTMTGEQAMKIVATNIQGGNAFVIEKLLEPGLTQN
jgi:hypothetical protein